MRLSRRVGRLGGDSSRVPISSDTQQTSVAVVDRGRQGASLGLVRTSSSDPPSLPCEHPEPSSSSSVSLSDPPRPPQPTPDLLVLHPRSSSARRPTSCRRPSSRLPRARPTCAALSMHSVHPLSTIARPSQPLEPSASRHRARPHTASSHRSSVAHSRPSRSQGLKTTSRYRQTSFLEPSMPSSLPSVRRPLLLPPLRPPPASQARQLTSLRPTFPPLLALRLRRQTSSRSASGPRRATRSGPCAPPRSLSRTCSALASSTRSQSSRLACTARSLRRARAT